VEKRADHGRSPAMPGHIITEAKRMGFTRLSLETGSCKFFLPARKLYEKVRLRILRAIR